MNHAVVYYSIYHPGRNCIQITHLSELLEYFQIKKLKRCLKY